MEELISWLLSSSPYVEYRTRVNLLAQSESDPLVISARKSMLDLPMISNLIKEITGWPGPVMVNHKSAGHPLHKLVFLADLGLTIHDPGMDVMISRVMEHQESDGPFQMLTNIPVHFGGSGEDLWAWSLCDAPSILYALVKFGLESDVRVQRGIEKLVSLVRENGWPCACSTQIKSFHGPGRKSDPCPYASLIMMKLLAAVPELRDSEASHQGAESLLNCWAERETFHPYIFYMGNDFCKLKAPLVWYDILHVVFVLSQFLWLKNDKRLIEMKEIISKKADSAGRFTAESIWTAWKEWDFGQKKVPSPWITYITQKILMP